MPQHELTWPEKLRGKNLVFLDGACVFCDRTAQALAKLDRKGRLSFAALQGPHGQYLQGLLPPGRNLLDSVVYVPALGTEKQRILTHSDAALMICRELGGAWKFLAILRFLPRPIRDAAYGWFASRRYRFFGKKEDACLLPRPGEEERFLG